MGKDTAPGQQKKVDTNRVNPGQSGKWRARAEETMAKVEALGPNATARDRFKVMLADLYEDSCALLDTGDLAQIREGVDTFHSNEDVWLSAGLQDGQ